MRLLGETAGIMAVALGERHTVLAYLAATAAPVAADAHAKHRLTGPARNAQDVAHAAADEGQTHTAAFHTTYFHMIALNFQNCFTTFVAQTGHAVTTHAINF